MVLKYASNVKNIHDKTKIRNEAFSVNSYLSTYLESAPVIRCLKLSYHYIVSVMYFFVANYLSILIQAFQEGKKTVTIRNSFVMENIFCTNYKKLITFRQFRLYIIFVTPLINFSRKHLIQ